MPLEYNVENDDYFKNFKSKPTRNENTTDKYEKVLTKFYKATGSTLEEIITTCIDEQNIVTTVKLSPDKNGNERRREIKFDINNKDASVNKYLNQYEEYCEERNNKKTTIQTETDLIRTFLKENGVQLPKRKKYENDADDWYLPTKEELNYILQDFSLMHIALGNFLTSTGMRVGDAVSLTIGDFMKATSTYHNFIDVEEFIDNAPEDMIGEWVFEPHKTKRHKTKCITFNTTHTSNLILQHLRNIKNQYIPNKNKRDGLNLKITKKYPLFGSRDNKFQTAILAKSVTGEWYKRNKKFKTWKIKQIKQKITDGELSPEDYDEAVSKIPKLHPHMCRKFFSTIVSNNCGDIRICALLEGHSDGLPHDKSYIKKSVNDVKEIYLNDIHDALSLINIETKIITNKETEELNKKVSEADTKIEALTQENIEKDQQIEKLKQIVIQTQEQMAETNKAVEELKLKRENPEIRNIITNYFFDNYREDIIKEEKDKKPYIGHKKCTVICELAYEFALENKSEFSADTEYLEKLIKKAIIKCSFNPDMILEKYNEIHERNMDLYEVNTTMSTLVKDIIIIIGNNKQAWEIVSQDQKALKNTIIKHIKNSKYNIEDITEEEGKQIAEDVIMDFIDAL